MAEGLSPRGARSWRRELKKCSRQLQQSTRPRRQELDQSFHLSQSSPAPTLTAFENCPLLWMLSVPQKVESSWPVYEHAL